MMRKLMVSSTALLLTFAAVYAGVAELPSVQGRRRGRPQDRAARREPRPGGRRDEAKPSQTGVLVHKKGAFKGYTLFSPMRSTTTYLIDIEGNVVHSWKSDAAPGQAVYLLDNGHLLRAERIDTNRTFHGGGLGGRIRQFDWDGKVVWEFVYADDRHMQHHDVEPLPNGNVLVLAWERKSKAEAIAAGCDPERAGRAGLWPDHIVEVKPNGSRGGTIVWEWHVWDHLIQDIDSTKANYGVVKEHPELIDINYDGQSMHISREQRKRLESLGYIQRQRRPPGPPDGHADWNHTNSIDYNAELDQIVLSVLAFNEVWVIDHSTTTEQASGHTGGHSGKGGDILYRWGNPQAYRAGTAKDRQLFAQHDAQWIAKGSPGAGHLLVFNNGRGRADGDYSSIDEIVPPLDGEGNYMRSANHAFGPSRPVWVYGSSGNGRFFSGHISGAQRLPNGNTLICSGEQGRVFEVDSGGTIVWDYVSPFSGNVGPPGPPGVLGKLGGLFHPPPPPDGRPPRGQPHGRPNDRGRDFPRRGGPPGPPPGQHDGPNALFRATRLAPDHPGLAGRL